MISCFIGLALGVAPVQSVDGGLSLAQVKDAISWRSPEINACLSSAPQRASVRYRFSVLPTGRVGQLGFVSAQKAESSKVTCVGTAIEKLRFPSGEGGAVEWEFSVASFDAGVPVEAQDLGPEEIPDRWADDVAGCYEATKPDTKQEGLVSVEFVALSSGVVVSASATDVAPALAQTTLGACLEDRARGWSLPGSGQARRLQAHFAVATTERRTKSFFVPSAPPRMVVANQPRLAETGGGLDRNVIKQVINDDRHRIRACYEMELGRHPQLAGRLRVHWTVGPDGVVIKSDVVDDSLESELVTSCVGEIIRQMKFPPPKGGGKVEITFPWVFKGADDEDE
jgi:hypothetical protein